ncbi:MAG: hypothetical protein CL934_04190 [Deltaproteobacteria bacterium]|jgi:hypothetical protein|nr:hypothetical protein [Deltaproteobacteria bacterium]|tara:strand:- start:185 stop:598 length:414 start_codon:yes stop_codon:yes gene_type:complete
MIQTTANFSTDNTGMLMKFLPSLIILGLIPFFSGCVYVNTEIPGKVQSVTQFELKSGDYQVIQRVNASGETTLWFGMVLLGGKGYQALLEEAKAVGGDTIMDYSFDLEQTSVLMFIYSRTKWKATGLAVKLSDSVRI